MRSYWVDMESIREEWVYLQGEVFHHVCDVCRQGKGDRFEVLASDGKVRLVEIVESSRKKATLKILSTRDMPPLPSPYIELCISIPRYAVMDKVVERSVEMGVYRVRPFVSDCDFIRRPDRLPESKFLRWQKVIRLATQQCGRGSLMTLDPVKTLEQLLAELSQTKGCKGLFLYEGNSQRSLKEALQQLQVSSVWAFVGSEGGFSAEEVERFSKAGLESLTLGDQVLKVETACISLLSILKYELVA